MEECSRGKFVAQVIDELFSRRVLLDRVGLAVLRLIDGERDLGSILMGLEQEELHLRPSLLQKFLEFFEKNLLLQGPQFQAAKMGGRESVVIKEERVTLRSDLDKPPLPRVYFLDEGRHNCMACGICCRGYEFGPLTDVEARRLQAETYLEEGERLIPAQKVVEKELKGKSYKALEITEDGSCIFLACDQKCILHREKGEEAKPWFCRMFPLAFVLAPDGKIFGSLQMECFNHYRARKRGRYLAEQVNEIRRILSVCREIPILSEKIRVGKNRTLNLGEYYLAEQWMLDKIQDHASSPSTSLILTGRFLRHLEEGGDLQNFDTPDPGVALLSSEELTFEVVNLARGTDLDLRPAALAGKPEGTSPGMRRFFLETVEFFSGEGDPDELLPVEEVVGPEKNPECVEILREFLRNEIFSKDWYRTGDLRRGFALTLMRYLLVVDGSRLLAHQWNEHRVSPKALCYSMSMVLRNIRRRHVEEFLKKDDSPLIRIYEALVEKARGPGSAGSV